MATTTAGINLLAAAKPIISGHEGERLRVYRDTLGVPTIGIGINMFEHDVIALCEQCGADYNALLAGTAELTPDQSHYLYEQRSIQTLEWLARLFPALFTYTQNRQIALLDMGYELGEPKFLQFRQMISAILQGNWWGAAKEALDSVWAKQVPERAQNDAVWIAQG